ncbi:hypothetical protein NFI96_010172 [Prochilodus magdalenae]|nr:hypothetical protein NFI96_010172 [Prochilodus magdalenae]
MEMFAVSMRLEMKLADTVSFMGGFEEGERVQSVSQGEGAVIPAPRIRSFPQPQVTWFRDGRKIPPSSRMSVEHDVTFPMSPCIASRKETGEYLWDELE